eukprot:5934682-Lingulodinium_polyedra.AAC.1
MEYNGVHWSPGEPNDVQRVPMAPSSDECHCTPLGINGVQSTPIDPNGSQWNPTESDGVLRGPTPPHGVQ